MDMIVTICNTGYAGLLGPWLLAIRGLTKLPISVLCLNGFTPNSSLDCQTIEVSASGNPFPSDLPDHACAEKLRLFEHLPEADRVLFLDLDVLVLRNFWDQNPFFNLCEGSMVIVPDLFVGYKEKMEEEFRPYDPEFRMRRTSDGGYHYFNTGVFFASRNSHANWFHHFLIVWRDYIAVTGNRPSIFDQNMINYCLTRYQLPVTTMPTTHNCLRQYEKQTVSAGKLWLNGQEVCAYHFNGGDGIKKLERWQSMLAELVVNNGSAES